MNRLTTTAVVLAGGGRDHVAALDPAAPNKAFVEICGRALVARTIDGLRASGCVGAVIVVAPESAAEHPSLEGADGFRRSGPHVGESLRAGLDGLDPDALALVATSDLPILSGVATRAFVNDARECDADLVYSCVERRVHERHFPCVPHTWAHFRDGEYCGGGLIALRPRVFASLERFLDRLGAARKNPLRLASIFGYDVLTRYALRRLRIADAERRAECLLHARVRAMPSTHPEIAVNVDRQSDVPLAERLILLRNARGSSPTAGTDRAAP